jgi:Zn finger protein HypA/HybF involved in hydrogenase expression
VPVTVEQIKALRCRCGVCGHEWITESEPHRCAKCKSRRWQIGTQGAGVAEKVDNKHKERHRVPENRDRVAGKAVGRVEGDIGAEVREERVECPDCGEEMVENVKMKRWDCECGFQMRVKR